MGEIENIKKNTLAAFIKENAELQSKIESQKEEIRLQHDTISEAIAKWECMQMDDDPVTTMENIMATLRIGHYVTFQEGDK